MKKPKISMHSIYLDGGGNELHAEIIMPDGVVHDIKCNFELSDLELAFGAYLKATKLLMDFDQYIRLVVSFHDYSQGIWLEFKRNPMPKFSKGEFIIQSSHG